jgi:dihydropteroate synthase
MAETVASLRVPVILMHMQGSPKTMQQSPRYSDLMGEICAFLRRRAEKAQEAGISSEKIIVDPGIGFGKSLEHNLEILRRLKELRSLGYPVLVGTSRKSLIGKVLDLPADQRLEGTAATVAISIQNGADIVRVHDVREMARVARMTDAIVRSAPPS